MKLDASFFTVFLHLLGLTHGSFKPTPQGFSSYDTHNIPSLHEDSPVITARGQNANCNVEPYSPPPMGRPAFAPFDADTATIYRYRQQQSVNLGSWFVHENWMSPSLFECAAGDKLSELDIASGWGDPKSARSLLERHWDTWITKDDFKYLASIGINTVRLPIGYWNLGPYFCKDTPFAPVAQVYQNSWPRVARAINMAAEFGIGVLVDLHGAPGSQNGQPHSGISDHKTRLFESSQDMAKTIEALVFLMEQLSTVTNVVGIQILNEPDRPPELNNFYSRAIDAMRQTSSPVAASFPLYVHNGFNLEACTEYVANRTDFVVQDEHSYFVFTPSDKSKSASAHTSNVKGPIADKLSKASKKQRRNLIIGEWSCALTPESMSKEKDKHRAQRSFCESQMNVYANTSAGWSFWSYSKEGCEDDPGWCFKSAVGNSLPATFFSYNQARNTGTSQTQAISGMVTPSVSEILSGAERNADTPQPSKHVRRSVASSREYHRFEAIHRRSRENQDASDESQLDPAQKSAVNGFKEGFGAAQIFATFQYSKLGFTGQYISDRIALLGSSVVKPGTEQDYADGFGRGLEKGQAIIAAALSQGHSAPMLE